jgi:alpha-ketoglutarate-dependent sulfate ester dioxygenase
MDSISLNIQPVAGNIGAEITGVRLNSKLDRNAINKISEALLRHKVIFFRNQHLSIDEHIGLARLFGKVTKAYLNSPPLLPKHPEILDLDYSKKKANEHIWHTDRSYLRNPPSASILRTIIIPKFGGDTIWANTITAYQDLPFSLRIFAEQLWALHTNSFNNAIYKTIHPVVRFHPESNDRSLFLGGYVRKICNFSFTESVEIIRLLQSYVMRPENTVRWRWQVGDLVFWDNTATQHYAIYDYEDQLRHVQRVTLAGYIPLNKDGRRSKSVSA